MKKLCIFDLDGTLLNTIDDIADSANRALASFHLPTYSVEWYMKKVGRGARNLVLDALPPDRNRDEEMVRAVLRAYQADYQRNCMVKTAPYPGVTDLLTRLTERAVKLAVISNKPHDVTHAVMKRYFPALPFAGIRGEMAGVPLKPDPRAAHDLLEEMGVSAADALFIGDSEVDMMFASQAGIFGIGVLWGFRDRETLLAGGAGAIVENAADIISFVSG